MKKSALFLALALLSVTPAFASTIEVKDQGVREGNVSAINFSTGLSGTKSGGTYTVIADPSNITSAVFEGATADAFETTLAVVDPTADQTITFPDATGTVALNGPTVVITAGATPTLTVTPGLNTTYTDTITTDNQDQTITFSGAGLNRDIVRIIFITDTGGSGDEVITFQTTLTNSAGTLTLANLTAGRYVVTFQSDGTVWNEVSRTAALS